MLRAKIVTLTEGQSYDDVNLYVGTEVLNLGLSQAMVDSTFQGDLVAFVHQNEIVVTGAEKIRLIHVNSNSGGGPNCIPTLRILLDGDAIYQNASIVPINNWDGMGIPLIFRHHGEPQQVAFVVPKEGLFIAHEGSILSIHMKHEGKPVTGCGTKSIAKQTARRAQSGSIKRK